MIVLHTLIGTPRLESFSPFCMKVETYLKAQGIDYESKAGDPRTAPKGKLPFIEDGGTRIADSGAIIDYLEAKADEPMDAGLDTASRAKAHVIRRTLEESLYFVTLWSRWVDDEGWETFRPYLAQALPAAVRWFLPAILRGKVKGQLNGQGTGRHSRDEIYALGKADIDAISALLGDAPYLLGDRVRTIDLSAYGFLANILFWEKDTPLSAALRATPNLEAYVKRIAAAVRGAKAASGAH